MWSGSPPASDLLNRLQLVRQAAGTYLPSPLRYVFSVFLSALTADSEILQWTLGMY